MPKPIDKNDREFQLSSEDVAGSNRRLMLISGLQSTVALALAACGGGSDPEPAPTPASTPTPTAAPTPAPTPRPTPAPTQPTTPAPTPAPAPITVTDGDFSAWTPFSRTVDSPFSGVPGPGTSTGAVTRVLSGGFPGPYLSVTQTAFGGEFVWSGGVKSDYTYDPATSGAIRSLSVTVNLFQPSDASGNGAIWHLLVEQGGRRFYATTLTSYILIGSWSGGSDSNLVASSFDTNPFAGFMQVGPDGNAPDFSASGAPMKFGIAIGTSLSGFGASSTSIHAIDNFSLIIAH